METRQITRIVSAQDGSQYFIMAFLYDCKVGHTFYWRYMGSSDMVKHFEVADVCEDVVSITGEFIERRISVNEIK